MTPIQIAYFKHFLFDRGLQYHYIGNYRGRKQKGNPESLEEFLQEASPAKAIMGAFYFKMNSDYGYDYWNDVKEKWLTYLNLNVDNPKNDSYIFFKGNFDILRQNWDNPSYYLKESVEDTYKRMHIENPGIDLNLFKDEKTSDEVASEVNVKEPEDEVSFVEDDEPLHLIDFSDVPEAEEQKQNSGAFLEGFSLVDTSNPIGNRKLADNVVTVNMRSGYRITFSVKTSASLYRKGYSYVKLLTNRDSRQIALAFNNSSGNSVCIKKHTGTISKSVVINSKDLVYSIHKFYEFGQNKDYFRLQIVNTYREDDSITFILKLCE
jgi:hypothetical protein